MEGILLEAVERNERLSKTRRDGFVPGVLYDSKHKENIEVKFESENLKTYLKKLPGKKVTVKLGQATKIGLIKELQREPLSGKILHIDIQTAGLNDVVKVKLPVLFEGRAELEIGGMFLDIQASEVTVYGKEKDIPDSLIVDVGSKKAGDVIYASMLKLGDGIKLHEEPDEILASVHESKRDVEPDAENNTAQAEAAAAAQ